MCDCRRGFGSDIRFIDHFNAQLLITLNYRAVANLHILQITVTLMFSVFSRHFKVTASNKAATFHLPR
jgi:hypothetical protein